MTTIYLVASGGSSKHKVYAVCSTEELAQKCVTELRRRDVERLPFVPAGEYSIEAMDLDGIFREQRAKQGAA